MEIKNKKILITGASGGIGSEIAKKLLDKDANLFLHRNIKKRPIQLSSLKWLTADFRDTKSIIEMFNNISELDVLINVVGIEKTSPDPLNISIWEDIFKVNLFGAVTCTQEAIKIMRKGGIIINISSIVGKEGITFKSESIAYPASKAALNKLTEGIVAMYSPKIRAITVSPGYTKTPMWDNYDQKIIDECLTYMPTGKLITPEEIAELVVSIIENDSINGVNIVADGGMGLKKIF